MQFPHKNLSFLSAAVILMGVSLYQQSYAHGKKHNPVRYKYVMQHGIPKSYLGQTNPLTTTSENLARGANLYKEHCASCHGATGAGDGEAAKDLSPRPPELVSMLKMIAKMKGDHGMMHGDKREMSMMTEGYVLWTVAEGGEPLETAMPGFKDSISEQEIWQIILFMMNGFSPRP